MRFSELQLEILGFVVHSDRVMTRKIVNSTIEIRINLDLNIAYLVSGGNTIKLKSTTNITKLIRILED